MNLPAKRKIKQRLSLTENIRNMNPKVDEYIDSLVKWQEEIKTLRAILQGCQLTEDLKWGVPCYTLQNKNIVLIHVFKEYCAISFFKGALLLDEEQLLIQQTENVHAARQIRFTHIEEIIKLQATLKAYIFEAIEVEKAGLKVAPKQDSAVQLIEELQQKFIENPTFQTAFNALTPGRQKAYNQFFSEAKQAKTRETRIEKYTSRILKGYGLHDCTCGLSKRKPNCDGSHKQLATE